MKFTKLIAAGLAIATLSLGAAAPAEAQRHDRGYSQDHRGDHRGYRNDRRNHRDDRRFRHNRRNDRGYSQRCRFETRGGQRIQRCR